MVVKEQSCPMQDGAEMGNDSSVKGAEMAPPRRIAVPCWLYDHQHAGRSRRKYCRTQRVREALPERDLCPNESRRSIRVDRAKTSRTQATNLAGPGRGSRCGENKRVVMGVLQGVDFEGKGAKGWPRIHSY